MSGAGTRDTPKADDAARADAKKIVDNSAVSVLLAADDG